MAYQLDVHLPPISLLESPVIAPTTLSVSPPTLFPVALAYPVARAALYSALPFVRSIFPRASTPERPKVRPKVSRIAPLVVKWKTGREKLELRNGCCQRDTHHTAPSLWRNREASKQVAERKLGSTEARDAEDRPDRHGPK